MAHKDWCGKPCSECTNPCKLDEEIPCSPDCGNLNEDGSRKIKACQENKCYAVIESMGECPVCGKCDLTYGNPCVDVETYQCYFSWTCEQCGASGKEVYNLEFARHLVD